MYLFDTDTVSNLAKRRPSARLLLILGNTPGDDLYLTTISIGEIVYGAHRLPDRTASILQRMGTI
ncbi:MAG TPA: hypothetical protein VGW38_20160, partial [Chloroflexota bacterium]|nr:hypothetical protein [Chloroflexota bacterium]